MSNNESFVEEVNEAVRRDRVMGYVQRYGWILVVGILAVVGYTAWREYSTRQSQIAAQVHGEALNAALEAEAPEAQAEALNGLAKSPSTPVDEMLLADRYLAAGDSEAALLALERAAAAPEKPEIYTQLALFKSYMIAFPSMDAQERENALAQFLIPGNPMRIFAMEQQAFNALEAGDLEAAQDILARINEDAEATPGQKDRAQSLRLASGEAPASVEGAEAPVAGADDTQEISQ